MRRSKSAQETWSAYIRTESGAQQILTEEVLRLNLFVLRECKQKSSAVYPSFPPQRVYLLVGLVGHGVLILDKRVHGLKLVAHAAVPRVPL